jgi:hypothetical protein
MSAALLATVCIDILLPLTIATLSLVTLKRFDAIAVRKSRQSGVRGSDNV